MKQSILKMLVLVSNTITCLTNAGEMYLSGMVLKQRNKQMKTNVLFVFFSVFMHTFFKKTNE